MKFAKALLMMSVFGLALLSTAAFAQEGTAAASVDQYASLAAGLAIAIAAFGGALGQGKTMVAALEGIARNPGAQNKIFIPMIIGLALIESLVLYAFVIAFVKIKI
ncbi:MAG: ATP synthase F0 subunit C [Oligoflexia bacterium]|nr:ATP synthase F0 subunit C [Oligoflexia bacterium]